MACAEKSSRPKLSYHEPQEINTRTKPMMISAVQCQAVANSRSICIFDDNRRFITTSACTAVIFLILYFLSNLSNTTGLHRSNVIPVDNPDFCAFGTKDLNRNSVPMTIETIDNHVWRRPAPLSDECGSKQLVRTETFEFNPPIGDNHLKEWEIIDRIGHENHGEIEGALFLNSGEASQTSDILVVIEVWSKDTRIADWVVLNSTKTGLYLNQAGEKPSDTCVRVRISIYIRPAPRLYLERLKVYSELLDVSLSRQANLEVNNLFAHGSHREAFVNFGAWSDMLNAHNVTITSITGVAGGILMAWENLRVHSEHGPTGGALFAPVWSEFEPKSMSFSTIDGEIIIGLARDVWCQRPFSHRIDITSVSGDISAAVPHGSYTNISTETGNIRTMLFPFRAAGPDDPSEFYTSSRSGDVMCIVRDAFSNPSDGKYQPLNNTISEHIVGNGTLDLRYGYSWKGEMNAHIDDGEVEFDATQLSAFRQDGGHIRATRGIGGNSEMRVHVETGDAKILLGL